MFSSTSSTTISFSYEYNKYKKEYYWACATDNITIVERLYSYFTIDNVEQGIRGAASSRSYNVLKFLLTNVKEISNFTLMFVFDELIPNYNTDIVNFILDNIEKRNVDINYAEKVMLLGISVKNKPVTSTQKQRDDINIKLLLDRNYILKEVLCYNKHIQYYPYSVIKILKKKLNCKSVKELVEYSKIL